MATEKVRTSGEAWRPVPGYEGYYEVSSLGRVRSVDRSIRDTLGRVYNLKGQMLRPCPNPQTGYYRVLLRRRSGGDTRHIHALVAEAFIGPRPQGHEVNHIDGDKTNNHVSNLEYVTVSQNAEHALHMGLTPSGSATRGAKLTEAQVEDVKRRFAAGERQPAIARSLGVSQSLISRIVNGRRWRFAA